MKLSNIMYWVICTIGMVSYCFFMAPPIEQVEHPPVYDVVQVEEGTHTPIPPMVETVDNQVVEESTPVEPPTLPQEEFIPPTVLVCKPQPEAVPESFDVGQRWLVGKKSPAIVYITQRTCPPCKVLDKVIPSFEKNYTIYKLDLNDRDNAELLDYLGVNSTPQILGVRNGDFIRDRRGKPVVINPVNAERRGNTTYYSTDTSKILKLFFDHAKMPVPNAKVGNSIDHLLKIAYRQSTLAAYVEPDNWQGYFDHNTRDHGFDPADMRPLSLEQLRYLHSAVHVPHLLAEMQQYDPDLRCPDMEGVSNGSQTTRFTRTGKRSNRRRLLFR